MRKIIQDRSVPREPANSARETVISHLSRLRVGMTGRRMLVLSSTSFRQAYVRYRCPGECQPGEQSRHPQTPPIETPSNLTFRAVVRHSARRKACTLE
eukprot:1055625-Prorocentrum_minimum.AAC.5